MLRPRTVRCLIAAALQLAPVATIAQPADLQGASWHCFEIVPAQRGAEPRMPMLLDRCRGKTWMLVKVSAEPPGRVMTASAFRWVPVIVEERLRQDQNNPVTVPRPPIVDLPAGSSNCFVFDRRRFCE